MYIRWVFNHDSLVQECDGCGRCYWLISQMCNAVIGTCGHIRAKVSIVGKMELKIGLNGWVVGWVGGWVG